MVGIGNSKRFTHVIGEKTFVFGYDHTTGIFFQVETKNNEIYNWSEFSPFQKRLTYENIQAAIKGKIFTNGEFKEVGEIAFGEEFSVYFHSIITTKPVDDDFKYPIALVKNYREGRGFKIKNLADYIKVLKNFKEPVTFVYAEWYKGLDLVFEFENESALEFCK